MKRVEQYLLGTALLMLVWASFVFLDMKRCSWTHEDAGLRMLLIGDPQIEGNAAWEKKSAVARFITTLNDLYMKLILDTLVDALHPSHVVVLGDLFSYQGTTDDEFNERLARYKVIFDSAITKSQIINITGNHDVGYGDEVSTKLMERFENVFGKSNFHWPSPLRYDLNNDSNIDLATIGIFNNLLMDPSKNRDIQYDVWAFTGHLASIRKLHTQEPFILVSHIPLYKQTGCVDKPHTLTDDAGFTTKQNHLSQGSTAHILDFIAPDVILTGHDHHGCSYNHTNKYGQHIAEFTIRSIMGDYSGTGALLEFHPVNGTWAHSFKYCHFVPLRFITTATIIFFILLFLIASYYFVSKCLCECIARA